MAAVLYWTIFRPSKRGEDLEIILRILLVLITTIIVIVGIDIFSTWKREALDKEYETSAPISKWSNCPICDEWMDISQTQKIINTKNGPEMCCIWHTNREMVDYFKRVQSEVTKDEKEKDIHG